MTTNQLRFHELRETQRANRAKEAETLRSNTAKERETFRHNIRDEQAAFVAANARAVTAEAARKNANVNAVKAAFDIPGQVTRPLGSVGGSFKVPY